MAYNRKTNLYEGYIYEIYNNVNDIKYIGQTRRTIAIRYSGHKKDHVDKICNLYEAMRNIGFEHFNVKQIEKIICNTLEELIDILNEKEIYWIKSYKDNGIRLYNMTDGGDVAPNKFLERPVIQYDLFCNKINTYSSMAEASEKTGVSRGDISTCCLKTEKIYRAGNYIWRYITEPLSQEEIVFLRKKYKPICQYDFDGNLLNTFYTINEAQKYLKENFGLNGENICNCVKGKATSSDGYIWRYIDDDFNKYHIPKQIKKVEQRDINTGKLIAVFDDCVKASIKTGCNKSCINNCCNHKNKQCGGYIWCFQGEYQEQHIQQKEKSVDRYTLDKKYIDSYTSITEASKALNINRNCIGSVCNNKFKTAGGYIWRFSDDTIESYLFNDPTKNKSPKRVKPRIYDGIPVEQRDKYTGNLIKTYNDVYEVSRAFNDINSSSTIIECCTNPNRFIYKNYYFCFKGDYNSDYCNVSGYRNIEVYDLENKYITTVPGYTGCRDFLKRTSSSNISNNIRDVCEGRRKTAFGYIWKYAN